MRAHDRAQGKAAGNRGEVLLVKHGIRTKGDKGVIRNVSEKEALGVAESRGDDLEEREEDKKICFAQGDRQRVIR